MVPERGEPLHEAKRQAVECLLSEQCPREALDWNPRLRAVAPKTIENGKLIAFYFPLESDQPFSMHVVVDDWRESGIVIT